MESNGVGTYLGGWWMSVATHDFVAEIGDFLGKIGEILGMDGGEKMGES